MNFKMTKTKQAGTAKSMSNIRTQTRIMPMKSSSHVNEFCPVGRLHTHDLSMRCDLDYTKELFRNCLTEQTQSRPNAASVA